MARRIIERSTTYTTRGLTSRVQHELDAAVWFLVHAVNAACGTTARVRTHPAIATSVTPARWAATPVWSCDQVAVTELPVPVRTVRSLTSIGRKP